MGFLVSPFLSPFAFGFLVARTTWRWAYGIGSLYGLFVVLMIVFFGEETWGILTLCFMGTLWLKPTLQQNVWPNCQTYPWTSLYWSKVQNRDTHWNNRCQDGEISCFLDQMHLVTFERRLETSLIHNFGLWGAYKLWLCQTRSILMPWQAMLFGFSIGINVSNVYLEKPQIKRTKNHRSRTLFSWELP
jgi:MFS family permease